MIIGQGNYLINCGSLRSSSHRKIHALVSLITDLTINGGGNDVCFFGNKVYVFYAYNFNDVVGFGL